MKTLIVYSTISGNTKSVCERIYKVLNTEKEIMNVKDSKNLKVDDYDNFIIGFWCDKGTMDLGKNFKRNARYDEEISSWTSSWSNT